MHYIYSYYTFSRHSQDARTHTLHSMYHISMTPYMYVDEYFPYSTFSRHAQDTLTNTLHSMYHISLTPYMVFITHFLYSTFSLYSQDARTDTLHAVYHTPMTPYILCITHQWHPTFCVSHTNDTLHAVYHTPMTPYMIRTICIFTINFPTMLKTLVQTPYILCIIYQWHPTCTLMYIFVSYIFPPFPRRSRNFKCKYSRSCNPVCNPAWCTRVSSFWKVRGYVLQGYVWQSAWLCVAECCSVSQCVACVAVWGSVLLCAAMCCRVLQCDAYLEEDRNAY